MISVCLDYMEERAEKKMEEKCEKFHGSISFDIADEKNIDVDFGEEIIPSKIVKKGDVVIRGRKAPKNIWIYELKFDGEEEYYSNLEKMINQLSERSEYVNQLTKMYEEVEINIFIGSDHAQIGFYLPNHIFKKIALLDCEVSIEIISFGMVEDEQGSLININNIFNEL